MEFLHSFLHFFSFSFSQSVQSEKKSVKSKKWCLFFALAVIKYQYLSEEGYYGIQFQQSAY